MNDLPLNYQRMLSAQKPPQQVFKDEMHDRYHEWQEKRDTAAKRLARATGLKTVKCPCGHLFSAEVKT